MAALLTRLGLSHLQIYLDRFVNVRYDLQDLIYLDGKSRGLIPRASTQIMRGRSEFQVFKAIFGECENPNSALYWICANPQQTFFKTVNNTTLQTSHNIDQSTTKVNGKLFIF